MVVGSRCSTSDSRNASTTDSATRRRNIESASSRKDAWHRYCAVIASSVTCAPSGRSSSSPSTPRRQRAVAVVPPSEVKRGDLIASDGSPKMGAEMAAVVRRCLGKAGKRVRSQALQRLDECTGGRWYRRDKAHPHASLPPNPGWLQWDGRRRLGADRFRDHRQAARWTCPMIVGAGHRNAGHPALADLEERPDVGCGVRAVKNDRVEAADAQAEGGKLGLRFVGERESIGPVVVTNGWELAKQDLVANECGSRGGRRRRRRRSAPGKGARRSAPSGGTFPMPAASSTASTSGACRCSSSSWCCTSGEPIDLAALLRRHEGDPPLAANRPAGHANCLCAQAAEEALLQLVDVVHQLDNAGLGFQPQVANAGDDGCPT